MDDEDEASRDGDVGNGQAGASVREVVLPVADLALSTLFWSEVLGTQPERGQESDWSSFALAPGLVLLLLPGLGGAAGQVQLGLSPSGSSAGYVRLLVERGARPLSTPPAWTQTSPGSTVLETPDGLPVVVHRR